MLEIILTLALVGLVVWLVTTYIPMPQVFKTIILVVVAVVLILWLMRALGISDLPAPRMR